ncbi:Tim44/TimA family putative adaptor protein [Sphingomonas crusticola]|uniref:Tim44/TimA family putative adaptor protein n=1 Tax=Sphingomonas crusticola TaxID=1697973 RepID=UPI000E266B0E|nr:Tim44/TimA family putative adaptor protein [Sphingomonas crusticola]
MTTLIVLALVFVFVALRLWSVLGKRTGHEQTLAKPESVPTVRNVVVKAPDADRAPAVGQEPAASASAAAGLRAIAAADPQFDVARFVEGAKSAYGMVLEAYWRGDQATLDKLVDADVAGAFAHAIQAREAEGETLDNRLISIEQAQIEDANVENGVAHIRIRFEADVAAVTRDRDGNVVAGSLTDAVPTHDVWTFSRTIKSTNPNWMLTETDEAA